MKKLTLALVACTAVSGLANAQSTYQSPTMRGEIIETITPKAGTANLLETVVKGLPAPNISVTEIKNIPTVTITANTAGTVLLDVTLIDEFIDDVSPNARHYPTNFPTRTAEYITTENVKHLADWIEPYASAADASFDVVLRAAKLNSMARNLNLGTSYTVRAGVHMQKAIQLKPNDIEANYLFGMMLSETGGFKEGRKYLDKAVSLGSIEAEQSIAQADLLNDNRSAALKRLKALAAKHPDNAQIAQQIAIVEGNGYYIWNIKDDNLHVKPIK
ncbi:tetratricopeptide repeat protein [Moraxella marmotae]|uniref:tetratricopeptide repeat protein n=1 Tax=Moraxella marmotae TaxID=3344520 RepID=UPI0035F22E04